MLGALVNFRRENVRDGEGIAREPPGTIGETV
jgi:hypothetical protein